MRFKAKAFQKTSIDCAVQPGDFRRLPLVKQVDGWLEPASQIVQVVKEQMTTLEETYLEEPELTLLINEIMASNFSTPPADGQGDRAFGPAGTQPHRQRYTERDHR